MEYMRFADDISHLGLLQGPQKSSSILSGGTLALIRMSLKLLPFLKPNIKAFSKMLLHKGTDGCQWI